MSDFEQRFLVRFFDFLAENQVDYAVIRNHETLPRTVSGTDIDLTLSQSDFKRVRSQFETIAAEVGYRVWKTFPKNWSIVQVKFAPIVFSDPQEVIKIDFMLNGINWLGYDLMSREDLCVHTAETNGIRFLRTPACTLLSLLSSWTYGGRLKERYRLEYLALSAGDKLWVDQRLNELFGRYTRHLISGLEEGRLSEPPAPIRWRMIGFRRREGFVVFRALISFVSSTFRRIVSPPGEFIVVIGPDGTGKTSLVDQVEARCVRMYKWLGRFHFIPRLKLFSRMDRRSTEKYETRLEAASVWENRQEKQSVFSSLLRGGYHLFRFWAGYVFWIYPARIKGALVVGERWCYDWLLDPQSKGVTLPLWVRRVLYGLCPKPDKVVVVKCHPATAEMRKKELPEEEIQRQMNLMDHYIVPSKRARVLQNDGSLEDGFKGLLQILVD